MWSWYDPTPFGGDIETHYIQAYAEPGSLLFFQQGEKMPETIIITFTIMEPYVIIRRSLHNYPKAVIALISSKRVQLAGRTNL